MKVLSSLIVLVAALVLTWGGISPVQAGEFPGLKEPLKSVTENYLIIQKNLAADSFEGVPAASAAMKTAMASAPPDTFSPDFRLSVRDLSQAKNLHEARLAFSQVSKELIAVLAFDHVQTAVLVSAFCPMIKGYWVQVDAHKIENPYYGKAMLDCGEVQQQF